MWRYLQNVEKPPQPKKQTEAEKRKYYNEYEKVKRQRTFRTEWVNERPWLVDSEQGLVCSYCKDFSTDRTLQFVTGCSSYKLDSIVKHEKSNQHKRAVALQQAKENTKGDSAAGQIIKALNRDIIEKLRKLFANSHAIVMHNRPFSDYVWICDLDQSKGLEIGRTYRTAEYCKKFVQAIAEVEFSNVKQQLDLANFFCIIGDGSTDSSIKEQEMWYCRTCTEGVIKVLFIGVHAPERANAEGILQSLKHVVNINLKIEWINFVSKLAALSCDGASVMLGTRSGVGALLQLDQPSLITIHCMAHRLELCLKDSSKKIKLYDKSISVLAMGLYYFYHNSPLNRNMLVRTFSALNSSSKQKLLLPLRVGGTRWIGHTYNALLNLITSYKYIVGHLGQLTEPMERVSVDSKSKAIAFLHLLKSKDVLCFLHFLLDVLLPLLRLSKVLQDRTCIVANQMHEISTTLEVLFKYKTECGPYLRKVIDLSDEYCGTSITNINAAGFRAIRVKFIEQIEQALQKRFSDFSSSNSILKCTQIGNFEAWPKLWDELRDYGDKDLQTLMGHYQDLLEASDVNPAEAELEWTLLKKYMFDNYLSLEKTCPTLKDLNKQGNFKNILVVFDLIFTFAPSSAEAERGFSQLKLIKNDLRSKLGQESLNHCLGIKLLAEDIASFDPLPAIEHWNGMGIRSRRPLFKDTDMPTTGAKASSVHTYEILQNSPPNDASTQDSTVSHSQSVSPNDEEQSDAEPSVVFVSDSSDSEVDSDLEEEVVFKKLLESQSE